MKTDSGTRAALIVGVDHYEDDEIRDLACAENDAIKLQGLLDHAVGFDRTELLYGPSATSDAVLNTASKMARELEIGDLLLFYFAGHAVDYEGRHLLLCPQARYGRLRYMQQTVPVDLLREETELPGLNRVLVLDACRSDLLSTRDAHGQGMSGERNLRDVVARAKPDPADQPSTPPGSLAVLCSCAERQQAGELSRERHGLFTAALLRVLKHAAGAGDEVALDDKLVRTLTERMVELGRDLGRGTGQQPWIQRSGDPPVIMPSRTAPAVIIPANRTLDPPDTTEEQPVEPEVSGESTATAPVGVSRSRTAHGIPAADGRDRALASASMILAILGILAGVVSLAGLILGIAAIITGGSAINKVKLGTAGGERMAWGGVTLGIAAMLSSIVWLAVVYSM